MTQLRIAGMASLVLGLGLVGCGGDTTAHDSGVHMDQGVGTDAGHPDLGMPVDMGHSTDMMVAADMPGGSTCPTGACNLADGTGCPAGQACQLGPGTPATVMCQPSGTGTSGTTCASNADCAEGYLCEGGDMKCAHYCCMLGSAVGCSAGQQCNVDLTDGMGHSTGAYLCSNADDGCNVIAQTGCPSGQICYPGRMVTQCAMLVPPGVAAGGMCMHVNDCMAGFACVGATGSSTTCQQVCAMGADAGAAGMCPTGMTCGGVTDFPTGLGVCG